MPFYLWRGGGKVTLESPAGGLPLRGAGGLAAVMKSREALAGQRVLRWKMGRLARRFRTVEPSRARAGSEWVTYVRRAALHGGTEESEIVFFGCEHLGGGMAHATGFDFSPVEGPLPLGCELAGHRETSAASLNPVLALFHSAMKSWLRAIDKWISHITMNRSACQHSLCP